MENELTIKMVADATGQTRIMVNLQMFQLIESGLCSNRQEALQYILEVA